MALSQKRILFFSLAMLLLGASPALSVPLSSGVENPGVTAYDASGTTDPDGEMVAVNGTTDQGSESRILDHGSVATSSVSANSHMDMGHSTPGWILPAAAIGAGGGALFAFTSHKGGNAGSSDANALDGSTNLGAAGSGGGITAMGTNNGSDGGNPSDVPEPGTIFLMGAGIASFLGRRRILTK